MKHHLIISVLSVITFFSCSNEILSPIEKEDPQFIFNEFWTFVDQNYIFFKHKNIDWDSIYLVYSSQLNSNMSEEELFSVCESALLELKDNHNRIKSNFRSGLSYNVQEGFEIHFSLDLVKEKYLLSSFETSGSLTYGILENEISYVHINEMNRYGQFRNLIRAFKESGSKGLILDLRDNGGGDSNPIPEILSDFVTRETDLGYYVEKAGPDHDDKTEPLLVKAQPDLNFHFDLPVAVLINRNSYSASSYCASMFGELEQVTLVGQITGGGAGGNMPYQLSNGWIVSVSVSDFLDSRFHSIESGVKPDISIENTLDDILNKRDVMLEEAITIFK